MESPCWAQAWPWRAWPNTQVRTPTLIADFGQVYLSLQGGTTGTRVLDASNNEMLKIEADETQCLTRVLSVTNSASASTTGLVIKNTATTGTARLQLDANSRSWKWRPPATAP